MQRCRDKHIHLTCISLEYMPIEVIRTESLSTLCEMSLQRKKSMLQPNHVEKDSLLSNLFSKKNTDHIKNGHC